MDDVRRCACLGHVVYDVMYVGPPLAVLTSYTLAAVVILTGYDVICVDFLDDEMYASKQQRERSVVS